MTFRFPVLLALVSLAVGSTASRAEPAESPVIFWAHYMPQVANSSLHLSFEGNNDAWPLNSQAGTAVEQYKEHIRMALDSGINGFQMLAAADKDIYEAARQIFAETGRMFYVAPEWTDSRPDDPVKWADTMADFLAVYGNNPHLYKHAGRPVFFTYYSGSWEKKAGEIARFRTQAAARGIDPLVVPTISSKILLDREDLGWRAWPDKIEPGRPGWLTLGWEAATTFDMLTSGPVAQAMRTRLEAAAPGFLFIPGISAGYDSSNRPSQATHVPFGGLRTLLDNLEHWRGFRQFTYVTWNDANETLLVPSSRNVWGYNTILRYFHGLTEDGQSPFAARQAVVAYPVECLYGDTLGFQVLGLPARGEQIEVRARVELRPLDGGSPVSLQGVATSAARDGKAFLELRWDSGAVFGKISALQPRVTVECRRAGEAGWEMLHDGLLLPPIQFSHNLVHYPVGYAINLERVAPGGPLWLQVSTDALARVSVEADAESPIRRLHLSEGSRSLGVFRGNPAGETTPDEFFVRIETSANLPLQLGVDDGVIRDLYANYWDPAYGVVPVEKSEVRFDAFARPKARRGWRVARLAVRPESAIHLTWPDAPALEPVNTSVEALERGAWAKTVDHNGKKVTVRLSLTYDATDPNLDFPLPARGVYRRAVPLALRYEGMKVLHATALLENGRLAYSEGVVVKSPADEAVPVQWIATGGTFDDFSRDGFDKSWNPFGAAQVFQSPLARTRVPYFRLDLDEGAGARLNDRSFDHLAGRAWLEYERGQSHRAGYDDEANGHYEWLAEGRKGGALRLGEGARIRFRSKSTPIGAQTTSLWVKMSEGAGGWDKLNAGPFALKLLDGGRISGLFQRADCDLGLTGNAAWRPGWNHVVFAYDLAAVRLYVNGKLAGEVGGAPPVYQRTHNSPRIFFEGGQKPGGGLVFDGAVDEIEVIGCGLEPREVDRLWQGGFWREFK